MNNSIASLSFACVLATVYAANEFTGTKYWFELVKAGADNGERYLELIHNK